MGTWVGGAMLLGLAVFYVWLVIYNYRHPTKIDENTYLNHPDLWFD